MRPQPNPDTDPVGVFAFHGPISVRWLEPATLQCHADTVGPMRVWELAEQLRIPALAVIDLLRAEGEHVTSHLNHVPGTLVHVVIANAPRPSKTDADYEPQPPTKAELAEWARWRAERDAETRRMRRRRPGPRPVTLSQHWDGDDDYYDPDEDFRRQDEASTRDITFYAGVKAATVRQWVKRGYITPIRKERGSHVFNTNDFLTALNAIQRRRSYSARPRRRRAIRQPAMANNQFEKLHRVYPNHLLTLTQAADIAGLAPATIRSWIRRGHLKPHPSSRPRATKVTVAALHNAIHRR